VIVEVQATAARLRPGSTRHDYSLHGTRVLLATLAADATYGTGELRQKLRERSIVSHIRVKESPTELAANAAKISATTCEEKQVHFKPAKMAC
jgi:hypothetical protein